jgi:hypothetical protein
MKALSIYYVEKESPVQGAHAFDMLGNDLSNHSKYCNEFYANFLAIDSENKYVECFFPVNVIEKVFKTSISNYHRFSAAIAGKSLIIQLGNELSSDLIDAFESGNNMFSVLKHASRYFLITNFKFDLAITNQKAIPLFEKRADFYKGKFGVSETSWGFIDGGYDIDATFDGDPEAYWNID